MSPFLRSLRARAGGDDGASLVLVMVFVVCVGLVLTAILSYTQAGLTSAAATGSRQALAADASGALDVAINSLRNTAYADAATACPVDGLTVPGAEGELRVRCTPDPGTGISAGVVPITALNRPGSAVLTLGTSGTGVSKGSNGILRIKGRVYVNSGISVAGTACPSTNCSQIAVDQAPVVARGTCDPLFVTSTVSVTCPSTGSPPEGKDPATLTDADIPPDAATANPGGAALAQAYVQPASGAAELVHRVVPAACPSSGNVDFLPGYYDDAVALTSFTSSCNRPLHFTPGVYYFDFRNEDMSALAASVRPMSSGTNVWTVDNTAARIVGGTLTAAGPASIPGSCVSPLTTTVANNGVQFVFGGTSRMDVQAGRVELCGQYATDRPSLVVYGAKTGTTLSSGAIQPSTTTTATAPATAPTFSTPDAARVVDGAAATTTITRPASNTTVATTLRLTGMNLATQIPAGSVLTSAELRVTHKESTTKSGDALTVALTPNPTRAGPAPTVTTPGVPINASATQATSTVSLTSALVGEVWRYGLSDLRMDWTVEAGKAQGSNTSWTSDLDGAQLWLQWRPPSLRTESGTCVQTTSTCPLLQTNGSQTSLYLQGTTYAPLAHFNLNLTNVSGQVFKSGVVARSLAVSVTPSAGFVGPVIEIPEETGSGVSLDVDLTAYSCRMASCASSAAPPSADWRRVGRASVTLQSAFPVPSTGSRAVEVKAWNVLG